MIVRWKGSVTVTALITAIILLILALTFINMTYYIMQNSQREIEKNRGRWFLEGRVQEYFDSLISGAKSIQTGRFTFEEKLDGAQQNYVLEVEGKEYGRFQLNAEMNWKNHYIIKQKIEFSRINFLDYALFANGNFNINLYKEMAVKGNILAKGDFKINSMSKDGIFFYYHDDRNPFKINYLNEFSIDNIVYYTNGPEDISSNPRSMIQLELPAKTKETIPHKTSSIKDLILPSFFSIWDTFYRYRDTSWIIDNDSFFETFYLINYVSSQKEMISFGNGVSTRFYFKGKRTKNVYIKKTDKGYRYQTIVSPDYSYYSGRQNQNFYFRYDSNNLILMASEQTVNIDLSDVNYFYDGFFKLYLDDWSYISPDENIQDIYLNKYDPNHLLRKDRDYEYDRKLRQVKILSDSFYKDNLYFLGTGDGSTTKYYFPRYPGKSLTALNYYINNQRATNVDIVRFAVVYRTAPLPGERLYALDPPIIMMKKEPPSDETGVFIDSSEKVAVLDFDQVQNYPKNGVILSHLPVYIKGSAHYPVAVISTENIYLGNINTGSNAAPLLAVSQKGVWAYQRKDDKRLQMNQCFIYSPLSGLYTIQEDLASDYLQPEITGTLVLTFENTNAAMEMKHQEYSVTAQPSLNGYLNQKPFVFLPMLFNIESLKRN